MGTPPEPSLLDLPASVAAAQLVGSRLGEARDALERLGTGGSRDPEALHDFRVAIRRMRSLLRAHRSSLRRAAGRKLQRRLRALGAVTNESRDAEVQIEWLEAARERLSRGERSGLNWLLSRLRAAKRAASSAGLREAKADFGPLADELSNRLDAVSPQGPPFRQKEAARWKEHAGELVEAISAIRGAGERAAIHRARIRAKRARYLIEPLRSEEGGAKPLLKSLKRLQDLLGDLHDAHVLEATLEAALDEVSAAKSRKLRDLALAGDRTAAARERRRDERLGLIALAALVRTRRDQLFADFRQEWTDAAIVAFADEAGAFADLLLPPPPPPVDSAPIECERKYLLKELPAFVLQADVREIDQGWLPGQTLRERIRRTRDANGERYFRTIKLGAGVSRIELEEECDRAVFDAMWPLTQGCRIRKRRYLVPTGQRTWEIDEFLDRDLALAEIELASEHEPVEFPEWLAPFVVREVTDEGSYTNLALATSAR